MSRSGQEAKTGNRVGNDLEPYRRLVELQKQMIELAQHHDQSRRECEAFRAQVQHEIAARMLDQPGLNHRLRSAVLRLNWLNQKETPTC
jgi:hypothetical protein